MLMCTTLSKCHSKHTVYLNLAVWPQTDRKKILAEFEFGGGVLRSVYQGVLLSHAEVPEQSHEFANLQELKLAAC